MKKKRGAQQNQESSNPFLGRKVSFQEAYPQVVSLTLQVVADPKGFEESQTYHYSLDNPPGQFSPCPNNRCKDGGFNIGQFLDELITDKQTQGEDAGGRCHGHMNAGRHNSQKCHYGFKAKAILKYKEA